MERKLLHFARLFCLALVLHTLLCPHPAFLTEENRPYTAFSLAGLDDYLFDRLPARRTLLALARDKALLLSQNEFCGAICGKDGYLFSLPQTSGEKLQHNLACLSAYAARRGIPLCTVLLPNKAEVLTGKLPRFFTCVRLSLWQKARAAESFFDMRPSLRAAANAGKYIYYRGDCHLTALGSYAVYTALAKRLGYTAALHPRLQVLDCDFTGSEARKMLRSGGDRLAIFRFEDDDNIYHFDKTDGADPYGVFPGYLCGYTRIDRGNAKRVLMLCDSFGCSLAPFLCRHFDLDMVDLRYADGGTLLRITETPYDLILACYGMDTLAGYELLYKLNG